LKEFTNVSGNYECLPNEKFRSVLQEMKGSNEIEEEKKRKETQLTINSSATTA